MATFSEFETQWKQAAADLASKKFSDFKNEAVTDANSFLTDAKADLIKWTALLVSQQIDSCTEIIVRGQVSARAL